MGIHSIKIRNFKSIQETEDIRIRKLNVLIGPNGAGKSNFISFFKFLNKLFEKELQLYISVHGRSENFLYFGRKGSPSLSGSITFDNEYKNQYEFKMIPDHAGNLIFESEYSNYKHPNAKNWDFKLISRGGRPESVLKDDDAYRNSYLRSFFHSLKIFHFHDTSFNSKVKQPSNTTDYAYFQEDGGNLGAFLYRLQESSPEHFRLIERVIKSIAPFLERFYLKPDEINPQQIFLRWLEKGSEQLFTAHNLSDGTLRLICLATLLLQPQLPSTVIIDEPELGLHPFAISKLAGLIKAASANAQIIISTQSVNLVNEFSADDIIVVEKKNNQSIFKRQSEESLKFWLDEYSLGELWEKNILGGRP